MIALYIPIHSIPTLNINCRLEILLKIRIVSYIMTLVKERLIIIGGKPMSTNVYDILMERGFIEQCTHEDEVRELLGKESVTFI